MRKQGCIVTDKASYPELLSVRFEFAVEHTSPLFKLKFTLFGGQAATKRKSALIDECMQVATYQAT